MALGIVQEYPHIDYQTAYIILEEKKWNRDQAISELKQAKEMMDQKEKREEQAIYTVFQECPDMDFENIKTELSINGWNPAKVIQQFKEKNSYQFMLVNCANNSDTYPIKIPRDDNTDGMSIIRSLQQVKPIPDTKAYNIYRDMSKNICITYLQLSNPIGALGLENQPSHSYGSSMKAIYFSEDSEMKWE